MGIDKLLKKIKILSSDDGEAVEEEEVLVQPEITEEKKQAPVIKAEENNRKDDKVVDFSASAASLRERAEQSNNNLPLKVVVIHPQSLDDSQQIANCLKEKRPVVINFEGVDDQLYRRILDFVSGTTYALDGSVNSISNRVWLFSPKNVNVSVSNTPNKTFGDVAWEKK